MPVWAAARTVIRLRDCSTPQRIVFGAGILPSKLRKHLLPSPAPCHTQKGESTMIEAGVMPFSSAVYIDDRLERRSGLAVGLGGAVVGGTDDVEAALHGEHAAGVHFLRDEAAADFGDGAQGIAIEAELLDDDDHARPEDVKRFRRRRAPAASRGCGSSR